MKKRMAALVLALALTLAAGLARCDVPEYAVGTEVAGFRLESADEIAAAHSTLFTWRHLATGAQLCHVANDDTNRSFTIAFRTPVTTDTGLPHVFEHAALGGSERYPDPNLVFSMMYGTYSTHMNAYTSTTHTAYQTASLSEDQLMANMDVFLDGVFHPALLTDPHAMMRDAYRWVLPDADAELSLQGVVYSEMQGALTHLQVAYLRLCRLLWPGSAVGSETGGLPDRIPDMTWEDLKAFHARCYTPGNALIVLYGDLDAARFLTAIGEGALSGYDDARPDLTDTGYRPAEGDVRARFTYPAPADTEEETILFYAVPVGKPDAETRTLLQMALGILAWPEHTMERRMTRELNEATWSAQLVTTRAGSAIVFHAEGIGEEQAGRFREICEDALSEACENGFAEEDLRVYADGERYTEALSRETMDGVGFSRTLAGCWDVDGDARSVLSAYRVREDLESLVTDGRCQAALRDAVASAQAQIALVSIAEPGGTEREEAARARRFAERKAAMTPEEITRLVESTREYDAWAEESRKTSMLPEVTAVTVETLPEEVAEAEVRTRETDGLTLVTSPLEDTGYLSAELMLDLSRTRREDLLPLRLMTLLLGSLETGSRDRLALGRDAARAANGLSFGLHTLKSRKTGAWRPVFSISFATFEDLIPEAAALIGDVLTDTRTDDLEFVRSFLATDVLSRRRSYTESTPYALALLDARRQTDEAAAWTLLSGGTRLIEYEESLLAMDDAALTEELSRAAGALGRACTRGSAVLAVAGTDAAAEKAADALSGMMAAWPEEAPGERMEMPEEETGNTLFVIDSAVSYSLEYLPAAETGMPYAAAQEAFAKLAVDQVLLPVLRYQNSVYSVFFEITEDETLLMTYRDPSLEKTVNEVFPALGGMAREALQGVGQDTLDGYIASVYTQKAMPLGPVARAELAISGALEERDPFEEKRSAMRSLKALRAEDLPAYAEVLDRLFGSGILISVAGPQDAETPPPCFTKVDRGMLR